MSKNSKRKWEKPQLIVLVRIKPGESVLQTCKNLNLVGPSGNVTHCQLYHEFLQECTADLCSEKIVS